MPIFCQLNLEFRWSLGKVLIWCGSWNLNLESYLKYIHQTRPAYSPILDFFLEIMPMNCKCHFEHQNIYQSLHYGLAAAQKARSPENVKKPKLDVIVIDMVYFSFICLLKLILYNSKPQNQMCDWKPKMFLFCFAKILNQAFLHYSHIWLWGFFTFLVALAHGAAFPIVSWPIFCQTIF